MPEVPDEDHAAEEVVERPRDRLRTPPAALPAPAQPEQQLPDEPVEVPPEPARAPSPAAPLRPLRAVHEDDDIPWDDYIHFLECSTSPAPIQGYHAPAHYTLPEACPSKHSKNMQKLWLTEGFKNKFHKLPKPRICHETHLPQSDELYEPTKAALRQQIAAGKYIECQEPPKVSLPWFGVPKPDGSVRPIIDCRYVNKYMKAPKSRCHQCPAYSLSLPPNTSTPSTMILAMDSTTSRDTRTRNPTSASK
ncbi:hypothetical protein BGZ81_003230 [Podila clonocystis]|nr:hypothetical protein BGZ81_003230 [Podila clonocystis]